jgi:Ras-related C3 botulinum toxin substrate 1
LKRDKEAGQVLLHLWDTAGSENLVTALPLLLSSMLTPRLLRLFNHVGQEDYDRLRPLSYPGADIVLLCFSTVTSSSLESVKEKWAPEINHYVPDVPYFLIGTKIDLRAEKKPDPGTGEFEPVSTEEGEAMRKNIKAVKYIEVSSKTRENLDKVFEEAVDIVLEHRRQHEGPATGGATGATDAPVTRKRAKQSCTLL